ncbi:hypothetical protein H1O16_gp043 [Burkholderia phage BcepSaruman]|uniref:Uncharacterized protein n=1 Tax=Burkholderia phage BcepSaruman TaxID=2530032 RepID=A0A4D5ZD44_9CAUD|nr:hypothetical protein H1O16_gp043 [Burkholderia phage BcepSaruman]QBX06456.1 hypothetical protein BcepSaruman_043 [Burkholderia phage BcepSaruman]
MKYWIRENMLNLLLIVVGFAVYSTCFVQAQPLVFGAAKALLYGPGYLAMAFGAHLILRPQPYRLS